MLKSFGPLRLKTRTYQKQNRLHVPKDPKPVATRLALFCDNQGQTQFEFLYNKSVKGYSWDNKFGLHLATTL
jgi:hypothetical protein